MTIDRMESDIEGKAFFHSSGLISVEWSHRGHKIVCLIQTEYDRGLPKDRNDLSIYLKGKNVTAKYIDRFFIEPQRIRTTAANIAKAVQIIDYNLEHPQE